MNLNLYTPPQKKTLGQGYYNAARLLKSEPAPRARTRTSFGENANRSDLFDISEDFDFDGGNASGDGEYEYEGYEYAYPYPYPQLNTNVCYPNLPNANAYPYAPNPSNTGTNPIILDDPFYPPTQAQSQDLGKITEGVQLRFDRPQIPSGLGLGLGAGFKFAREDDYLGHRLSEESPSPYVLPPVPDNNSTRDRNPSNASYAAIAVSEVVTGGCSVCGRLASTSGTGSNMQAVLLPCLHPLCSACLTGALNIVGEKDMECCVCGGGVDDFRLVPVTSITSVETKVEEKSSTEGKADVPAGSGGEGDRQGAKGEQKGEAENGEEGKEKLIMGGDLLPSAIEFFEGARARSSPPPTKVGRISGGSAATEGGNGGIGGKRRENVVLRIDNVPWVCLFICSLRI